MASRSRGSDLVRQGPLPSDARRAAPLLPLCSSLCRARGRSVKAGLAQRRADSAPHLLVLGAGGQLGQALVTAAGASRLAAIGLTRRQLDVTDRDGVIETLRRLRVAGVI